MERKELTKAQIKFLEYCEKFGYGKLLVRVKDGQPVMVNVVVEDGIVQQDIKLD